MNVILCVALSFMILFSAVGYASLTEQLDISGSASVDYTPFFGIYIYDIQLVSTTSGSSSVSFSKIHPTSVSTKAISGGSGSITYKITVHNNTDVTYWYIGQKFVSDYESNDLLGRYGGISVTTKDGLNDSSSTFNSDDWVPPQTMRDFYVTYTYGSNSTGTLINLINFEFGIKMDAIHDKFLAVLNDKTSNFGYDYLSGAFDDKYADTGSMVLGNVGEDKYLFDSLFGSNMTVKVDGEDVPVTVMVRRENVDGRTTGDGYPSGGPSGCEYTVYITVDPLDSPTGEAIVHAVSYSCGNDGKWYQLGQLYAGVADREDYDSTDGVYEGAFDVYSWTATPNSYEVADGIIYNAGMEQGDQYDKYLYIEQLMSAADQDIFNDIDNTRIFKKAYDIIVANPGDSTPGITGLRDAFTKAAPYYNNLNNGQEFKVKRDCTRSEIIPYIIAIQTALDYYYEVN